MDEGESESAETEPLVPPDQKGTADDEDATARRGGARQAGRHLSNVKPRLSLVPESNEKSTEEDEEGGVGGGGGEKQQQQRRRETQGDSNRKTPLTPTPLCPFFGVKNYLHHFYEKSDVSDPTLYEDLPSGEHVFLVKQGDGGCSSSVFRLSLVLGGLLLLLGAVAFTVAAAAARRTVVVGQDGGVSVLDRAASSHNAQVDALLLVGLVAVTLGSTVVAAALISRTFCSRPEESPYPLRTDQFVVEPPFAPIGNKVPVTESLMQVQPVWGLPSHSTVRSLTPFP